MRKGSAKKKKNPQEMCPLLFFEFHFTLENCVGTQLVPSGWEGHVSCNSAFRYFQLQKVQILQNHLSAVYR